MKALRLIALLLLFLASPALWGYSSPNVPIEDRVYRDLDKLIAFGLIKDAVYGQRPWSQKEIARLIAEATKNLDSHEQPLTPSDQKLDVLITAKDIIDRLTRDYREELTALGSIEGKPKEWRFRPLDQASFEYTLLDSPPRDIPKNNGVGEIDGYVNPLVQNREGLDFVDGNNLSLETSHYANLSKYFSLFFRPHVRLTVPNTGDGKVRFVVQDLYGKFTFHDFEIETGRDHLIWGQSKEGGLLFSNNARSLDMIKISNDSPFYHPWIFRYLGPSKYTFFVANLGPERVFANSFLYGFKATIKPTSFLELGLSETLIIGGKGAPSLSFFDPLIELFPFNKIGHNAQFDDKSDHRFGFFDMRLTIPPLRNSVFYFESFFEDSPLRAIGHLDDFWDEVAMMFGFQVPLLSANGAVNLTTEYRHTPDWAYRHGNWITGYTLNRELIGDPLGPGGDSFLVSSDFKISDDKTLTASFTYERRGSDLLSQTTNPDTGGNEEVIHVQHNPGENRFRLASSLYWRITRRFSVTPQFAYERVTNFNFIRGDGRDNFLGGFTVTYRP